MVWLQLALKVYLSNVESCRIRNNAKMEKTLYLEEFMYLVMILLHYFPTCETYNVFTKNAYIYSYYYKIFTIRIICAIDRWVCIPSGFCSYSILEFGSIPWRTILEQILYFEQWDGKVFLILTSFLLQTCLLGHIWSSLGILKQILWQKWTLPFSMEKKLFKHLK